MTDLPAIHFEGIKYAYRQSRDGIIISFVVHPQDVPAELSTSSIGARYMVALVEIGDDEKPKPGKPKKERKAVEPAAPKAKKNWRDMPPPQQAALRCNEPIFRAFLSTKGYDVADAAEAAEAVRDWFGVKSRTEILPEAWREFDDQYHAWKTMENA